MDLAAELDALFKLPLEQFTAARNGLAARLKKSGHAEQAALVRTTAKPPVSAWAVNQLYWRSKDWFDRLIAAGAELRQAQTLGLAGHTANMHGPLRTQRDVLNELSRQAVTFLSQGGHTPSPDTLRRVTLDLQGLAAREPSVDGPQPGRLTADVDAPGFEAVAALVPKAATGATRTPPTPSRVLSFPPGRPTPAAGPGGSGNAAAREAAARELARAKRAAATRALHEAERTLAQARRDTAKAEGAMKAAAARVKAVEGEKQRAEAALEKASRDADAARQSARKAASAAADATQALDDAERALAQAKARLDEMR
jgi:hypothetical protein